MKREMYVVGDRLNDQEFESIMAIMKELYPRHKYRAYQTSKTGAIQTRYKILWNMTPLEAMVAEQIILKQIAPNSTTYII